MELLSPDSGSVWRSGDVIPVTWEFPRGAANDRLDVVLVMAGAEVATHKTQVRLYERACDFELPQNIEGSDATFVVLESISGVVQARSGEFSITR